MTTFNRRAFLKRVGVATGTAVISASPVVAGAAIEPGVVETAPSSPIPREPIVVIVRDSGLGEVTVLSGTTEKTYKDRVLVQRLLKAAGHNHGQTGSPDGVR